MNPINFSTATSILTSTASYLKAQLMYAVVWMGAQPLVVITAITAGVLLTTIVLHKVFKQLSQNMQPNSTEEKAEPTPPQEPQHSFQATTTYTASEDFVSAVLATVTPPGERMGSLIPGLYSLDEFIYNGDANSIPKFPHVSPEPSYSFSQDTQRLLQKVLAKSIYYTQVSSLIRLPETLDTPFWPTMQALYLANENYVHLYVKEYTNEIPVFNLAITETNFLKHPAFAQALVDTAPSFDQSVANRISPDMEIRRSINIGGGENKTLRTLFFSGTENPTSTNNSSQIIYSDDDDNIRPFLGYIRQGLQTYFVSHRFSEDNIKPALQLEETLTEIDQQSTLVDRTLAKYNRDKDQYPELASGHLQKLKEALENIAPMFITLSSLIKSIFPQYKEGTLEHNFLKAIELEIENRIKAKEEDDPDQHQKPFVSYLAHTTAPDSPIDYFIRPKKDPADLFAKNAEAIQSCAAQLCQ